MADCICGHYESEHDVAELGRRCRVRIGFNYKGHLAHGRCDCPGFEPDTTCPTCGTNGCPDCKEDACGA